jgi:hypothetical protein
MARLFDTLKGIPAPKISKLTLEDLDDPALRSIIEAPAPVKSDHEAA